jgi:superfamily I DNA/RNA helicase
VGDDDQSIYGFRQGLGKEGLDRFLERFRTVGVLMLYNYRCKREILDWAGEVIAQNQDRVLKRLEAARGPGGRVRLVSFSSMDLELDFVARRVQQLVASGKATSDQPVAVIARQNWILDEFEDVIGDTVPFDRPKGDSLWDRSDVGAVISFLRCVADPERESAGLDHLLSAWGATAQDIEAFRQAAPEHAIAKLVPCWSADHLPVSEAARRAIHDDE